VDNYLHESPNETGLYLAKDAKAGLHNLLSQGKRDKA